MITIVLVVRTIIVFLLILFLVYLLKRDNNKRLKELNDLLALILLLLSSNLIINYDNNIFLYLIPIITLCLLREVIKIILVDNNKVKNIFDGNPIILVKNGKIYFKNMVSNNYTMERLLKELRKRGIYTLEKIKYVFLESNGEVSIFPNEEDVLTPYPVPVILDGKLNNKVVSEVGVKKDKIIKMLKKQDLEVRDIYYAMYKGDKLFIITKKELK